MAEIILMKENGQLSHYRTLLFVVIIFFKMASLFIFTLPVSMCGASRQISYILINAIDIATYRIRSPSLNNLTTTCSKLLNYSHWKKLFVGTPSILSQGKDYSFIEFLRVIQFVTYV